jgi:two-component system LytT family sensor kinase
MTIDRKYSPYIFIAVCSLVFVCFGYFIAPEFPWYLYVIGFFWRFLFLSAIWQLIRLINKKLEKRFSFEKNPGLQILLQVMVTLIFISPVFIVSYLIIKPYLHVFIAQAFSEHFIPVYLVVLIILIMMMTFGYYTYDLFIKHSASLAEKTRMQLEAVQLAKEKSMMRFHHLKNQVNPHFLFNTLTSLDGLIQSNPDLASEFIRHLSKVYRYVLEHKENEVVSLETELNFIQHYISLLKIRYEEAIDIGIFISETAKEKGIVMVTLQMLIDNAIKHNVMQKDMPLEVKIWDEGDMLHVQNNKQSRKQILNSSQQGLKQLQELYSFLSRKTVDIADGEGYFEINLPLI